MERPDSLQLVNVYNPLDLPCDWALNLLYDILAQRDETTSISHRDMPTWQRHVKFVTSHPYKHWWALNVDGMNVGAAYLSKSNEIGVFILKEYQGNGYGPEALRMIINTQSPGTQLLANINPRNARSIAVFERLGFQHVQNTYRLSRPEAPPAD